MKSKEVITNFIKKYKIETIAVLAISFISAALFDIGKISSRLFEVLCVLFFVAMGTFLVDNIFGVYEDKIKEKIREKSNLDNEETVKKKTLIVKVLMYIFVILIQYLLFILSLKLLITINTINDENILLMAYSAVIVTVMSSSLISYFVIKGKKISAKDYLLEVFINYLFVSLVEWVVLAGFLILYFICEMLLGRIPYYIISRIIVFVISIITLMGFFVGIEKTKKDHSLFSKILVGYIMQIKVFIGFVIFYIYLIKIIIKHELPSNQVFSVCTILFSIGLSTALMSLGVNDDVKSGKESIYSKAIKFLPIAFIPALILQIISIVLRINQHGLTTTRHIGVVIIIFEIIYLIYYILDEILKNKKVKIESVFLLLCIVIGITFLVPKINVYEFPEIYNSVLKKEISLTKK